MIKAKFCRTTKAHLNTPDYVVYECSRIIMFMGYYAVWMPGREEPKQLSKSTFLLTELWEE